MVPPLGGLTNLAEGMLVLEGICPILRTSERGFVEPLLRRLRDRVAAGKDVSIGAKIWQPWLAPSALDLQSVGDCLTGTKVDKVFAQGGQQQLRMLPSGTLGHSLLSLVKDAACPAVAFGLAWVFWMTDGSSAARSSVRLGQRSRSDSEGSLRDVCGSPPPLLPLPPLPPLPPLLTAFAPLPLVPPFPPLPLFPPLPP